MIIANYGGSQGFDNDDGSSWYGCPCYNVALAHLASCSRTLVHPDTLWVCGCVRYNIHHNVIYGEGLKQDYGGHDSKYHHNLNIVHQYDGQNCINTWPFKTGQGPCGDWSSGKTTCSHAHRFEDNKCVVLYTDVYSPGAGGCPPGLPEMALLANNSYYTPNAGNATMQGCGTLAKLQSGGVELGSESLGLPADNQWLEWAADTLEYTRPL